MVMMQSLNMVTQQHFLFDTKVVKTYTKFCSGMQLYPACFPFHGFSPPKYSTAWKL